MLKKIAICPGCQTKISCEGELGQKVNISCSNCGRSGSIIFNSEYKELDFYPLIESFSYAKILKNMDSLEKTYKVIEPNLSNEEEKILKFIGEGLMKSFNLRLDELESVNAEDYLTE